MKKTSTSSLLAFAVSVLGFATSINCAFSQTLTPTFTSNGESDSGYVFSTDNDLIVNQAPIASVGDFGGQGGSITFLTDGTYGQNSGPSAGPSASQVTAAGGPGPGVGISATYSLGANALGYTLNDIEVYSGWGDNGRYQQAYTLSYSLVSDPSTFVDYFTSPVAPTWVSTDNGAMTEVASTNGILLTGVDAIKITFNSSTPFDPDFTGYTEFVVNGVPTEAVPEPSTWAMLLTGMAGLIFVLRRRQAGFKKLL